MVTRDSYAKEIMLLNIGNRLVDRYKNLCDKLYDDERKLSLKRGFWGTGLEVISTLALYGVYIWIALSTIVGMISLGTMTMYLSIFKQGQGTFSSVLWTLSGFYENNLYIKNLVGFLSITTTVQHGEAIEGPEPGDGLRFEDVSFTYPGEKNPTIEALSLHIKPGQQIALVGHNGSGKTTIVKLMAGLYQPSSGRILLDGLDLRQWDIKALHQKLGIIFQDFVRYQFSLGENIDVGDLRHADDIKRRNEAAQKGMAADFIDDLPDGYNTQLGTWFEGGRELSLGQWQKVALSRAFMRDDAYIWVLDEPTASMDAKAEADVFERVMTQTHDKIVVLISHRLSTIRFAHEIVVLDKGKVVERGTHETLMQKQGTYAELFSLQARGYMSDVTNSG